MIHSTFAHGWQRLKIYTKFGIECYGPLVNIICSFAFITIISPSKNYFMIKYINRMRTNYEYAWYFVVLNLVQIQTLLVAFSESSSEFKSSKNYIFRKNLKTDQSSLLIQIISINSSFSDILQYFLCIILSLSKIIRAMKAIQRDKIRYIFQLQNVIR